jgi:MarR family transcriptional regulator, lower aerobic nicotinate degradation pathway regulator
MGREAIAPKHVPRAIRAAYLGMHRLHDARLARYGVTADQFVLLIALAELGEATQQDLVRWASSDPSTVRAMLVLLERRGLVKRERHPDDSRARRVSLTAKGKRVFAKLWEASTPIRAQLLGGFEREEIETLVALLERVIANVSSHGGRRVASGKR